MSDAVHLLGVCGTSQPGSRTRVVLELALAAARASGATTRVLDLAALELPVMVEGDPAQKAHPAVREVRESAEWAHGYVLATPEYHGNMSGALKNWFDFLWKELAGKLCGVVAVTWGGHAEQAIATVKNTFQWCHGWTLPFHAAARNEDFRGLELIDDRVRGRIERIGHDLAHFAPLLYASFRARRDLGSAPETGFAGLHATIAGG